jgi:hypothetical protein
LEAKEKDRRGTHKKGFVSRQKGSSNGKTRFKTKQNDKNYNWSRPAQRQVTP